MSKEPYKSPERLVNLRKSVDHFSQSYTDNDFEGCYETEMHCAAQLSVLRQLLEYAENLEIELASLRRSVSGGA